MSALEIDSMPPIAVLCGGLATRLGQMAKRVPKSMLEVAGEPFIAHQLRLLSKAGFKRAVLLCGFLGDQIQHYVGDGSRFGISAAYSFDGPQPLGTGGAVRKALPLLDSEFMLIYGDSYLPTDYRRVYSAFKASSLPAVMAVFQNRNRWDRSNVEFRDGLILRYEKNEADHRLQYIDYGLSAFRCEVFSQLEADKVTDLSSIQRGLAAAGRLAGIEIAERFYEIGSAEGLVTTDAFLRRISAAGSEPIKDTERKN